MLIRSDTLEAACSGQFTVHLHNVQSTWILSGRLQEDVDSDFLTCGTKSSPAVTDTVIQLIIIIINT